MKTNNIETVAVKYIKGGKEVVKYNTSNGKCWVENVIKGKDTVVIKTFCLQTPTQT
jgi:hypothetical protein